MFDCLFIPLRQLSDGLKLHQVSGCTEGRVLHIKSVHVSINHKGIKIAEQNEHVFIFIDN
jgi:hypothetical protein